MLSRLLFKDGGGLGGVVMIQARSDSTFNLPSALFEALHLLHEVLSLSSLYM